MENIKKNNNIHDPRETLNFLKDVYPPQNDATIVATIVNKAENVPKFIYDV